MLSLLITASDYRGTDKEAGGYFCHSFNDSSLFHPGQRLPRDLKESWLFYLHFSLFPLLGYKPVSDKICDSKSRLK
jgi:hypothetical protein